MKQATRKIQLEINELEETKNDMIRILGNKMNGYYLGKCITWFHVEQIKNEIKYLKLKLNNNEKTSRCSNKRQK